MDIKLLHKIMIVDDNEDDLFFIKRLLKKRDDFAINSFLNAKTALASLKNESYSCILLDYNISNTTAIEFIEKAREIIDVIPPVIILTGQGNEHTAIQSMKKGVSDYLIKSSLDYTHLSKSIELAIEKHTAKQTAKENMEFISLLIDSVPEPLFFVGKDGLFKGGNKAFSDIIGVSIEKLIGQKLPNEIIPKEFHELFKLNLGATNEMLHLKDYDVSFNIKENTEKFYNIRNALHRNSFGEIIGQITVMHDFTERKQQEDKIKQIAVELDDAIKTKDRFFSIIAHDLKNPFGSLLMFSKELEKYIVEGKTDRAIQFAAMVKRASEKGYNLLINLLEWATLQTNRIAVTIECVDVTEVLLENISIVNHIIDGKNIIITYPKERNVLLHADRNLLNTIFRNIISNALKYTPEGGEITFSILKSGKGCEIAIKDSGIGISKERVESLFKVDAVTSTKGLQNESGTGLGLILCKEFAIKMGGNLSVYSEEGEGTTFTLSLPAICEGKECSK